MTRMRYATLVVRAWLELLRHDVLIRRRGFGAIVSELAQQTVSGSPAGDSENIVADALLLATCLYWKPVLCLQRSVCLTRLLRRHGVCARLVIGYRPVPFFSHAWVEVEGRVVNDSPAYRTRLQVLYTA
jgi:hypothetical protein